MTSDDGMRPFEPAIRAAVNSVEAHIEEVRAARASASDEWLALRVRSFWNGDSALALSKPRTLKLSDVSFSVDDVLQEYKSGLGVVAVLLRGPASSIDVDYTAEGATARVTVPITEL